MFVDWFNSDPSMWNMLGHAAQDGAVPDSPADVAGQINLEGYFCPSDSICRVTEQREGEEETIIRISSS